MSTTNPFPGINPWLQDYWRDFHGRFLVYLGDALNEMLPTGMTARVEERLAITTEQSDDQRHGYYADVAVAEDWDRPADRHTTMGNAVVAEPRTVEATKYRLERDQDQAIERFLEVVYNRASIITTIELISPSNKESRETAQAWHRRRKDHLQAGINMVEIDLVRGGRSLMPFEAATDEARIIHEAWITRYYDPNRPGYYAMPLREKLPTIRIPLRRTDDDAALDLQALVNQVYVRGRYAQSIDYSQRTTPTLPRPEELWANDILRQANLLPANFAA
jgi:hypothetical protein